MSEITSILAKELIIAEKKIDAALKLLDEGNTIPFIARYRKEVTGELDEEQLRHIQETHLVRISMQNRWRRRLR